jgi:hypothetical protein
MRIGLSFELNGLDNPPLTEQVYTAPVWESRWPLGRIDTHIHA